MTNALAYYITVLITFVKYLMHQPPLKRGSSKGLVFEAKSGANTIKKLIFGKLDRFITTEKNNRPYLLGH
jgi:hypothetical protein